MSVVSFALAVVFIIKLISVLIKKLPFVGKIFTKIFYPRVPLVFGPECYATRKAINKPLKGQYCTCVVLININNDDHQP